MGDSKQAEELLLSGLDTCKRSLGEEHRVALNSTAHLSRLHLAQQRPKAAEELSVTILETRERSLVREDGAISRVKLLLARSYMDQGQCEQAEVLLISIVNDSADSPLSIVLYGPTGTSADILRPLIL